MVVVVLEIEDLVCFDSERLGWHPFIEASYCKWGMEARRAYWKA